jgi:hypothetical protein
VPTSGGFGEIRGIAGDNTLHFARLLLDHTGPNLFVFNWTGINRLRFHTDRGVPVPGLRGGGGHFVVDNFMVNAPVPEPTPISMVLVALIGVAGRHRRLLAS